MSGKCVNLIRLPCDLKAKVKQLAQSNGLTCSELIRLSIEAKLPDCEVCRYTLVTIKKRQKQSVIRPELRP